MTLRRHWLDSILVLVTLAGTVGSQPACRRSSGAVPDAAASEPIPTAGALPAGTQHRVRIDPELVRSGRVQVKPAERRALADEVLASGEVVPAVDGEARIGALVSGRVTNIMANEGDRVLAGQVLAWIDAPDAARMQGDWLKARAQLWRAQKLAEQERALWADKATSQRALQAAEAELREAEAAERATHSLLVASHVPVLKEDAGVGSARISVATPIAGVVSKRNAVVGGHVSSDTTLFEIVAPEKLLVRANVPEVVAQRVQIGSQAIVRLRGVEQTCVGNVLSRLDRVEDQKRTMGVMVRVNSGCPRMVAGGFADVTVRLSASGAPPMVVAPRAAIVEFDGAPSVFVENASAGPGQFDVHPVRLGLTDGVHTVVEEGLKEGDPVVVVGALLLKGEHIRRDLGGE